MTAPRRVAAMVVANAFVNDSRVLKEAHTLLDRGWSVTVVAERAPGLAERELHEGIEVVRVPREPVLSRLLKAVLVRRAGGANGAAAPASFAPAGEVAGTELRARRLLEALTHARFWRRACAALVRSSPSVVIAHDLDALPAGWLAARLRRVPLVYDSHELWLEMPPILPRTRAATDRWRRLERRLARGAALVVTVSDGIAEELVRRYGIDRPLVLRNVPVTRGDSDAPGQDVRDALGVEPQARIIVYTGGIHGGRGIEQLVTATRSIPDAVLALVGTGDASYLAELIAMAPERIVRPLGAVPSETVSQFVSSGDVGVVPYRDLSLNHHYALPTKLFEYLGGGLPVVTGNLPEIARLVTGYEVGITCDTDDPASIAAAISGVLERHDAFRANAVRAAEQLCWEREVIPYAEALDRLAASSR